ncbi:hypothetical protein Tco_0128368 [Tanacetum coccineum]
MNETYYEPNPSYDYSGFDQPQPPQDSVDHQRFLQALNKIQEELEEIKRDRRKKIEDMSIEEMRHEQQLVDYKIKDITNDLGYKRFRGEKIDEEYKRDCEIRIQKLKQGFNEWGSEVRKKEQAYNEEHYSATYRRMLSIPFVDEDDYIPLGDIIARYSTSKAITPDLPIEEPDNSLSMGDEHLSTIPTTESDKIDPILEEFAGELAHIPPIPPGIVEANFDPNDDTSSDDDDFEDVEYVSLEEVNDEKEFNLEDIFQIQDVILREKLLNVHRLISNIESLKVNPITDRVLKSLSLIPISVTDSDSFLEESIEPDQEGLISIDNSNNTFLELPEFESFHFDPSFPRPPPEPPDVEICLHFEPDALVIDNFNELNDNQRGSEIDFSQNVEDDDSFTFVIRTFLPFLIYPEVSPLSCSTRSEDTIFDPDIFTYSRCLTPDVMFKVEEVTEVEICLLHLVGGCDVVAFYRDEVFGYQEKDITKAKPERIQRNVIDSALELTSDQFVSLTSNLLAYHQGTVSLQKCFFEYQGIRHDQRLKNRVRSKARILGYQ